jgi:hypothetical protein
MSVIVKNKSRIARHIRSALDALDRAVDGLEMPDNSVQEDCYVLQQLAVCVESCQMAKDVMLDLKRFLAEQAENALPEG